MKDSTAETLRAILQSDKAWDGKTRRLKLSWVLDEFSKHRERLWMSTVYFPRFDRAVRLIRAFGLLPADHFEPLDVGLPQPVLWITCEDCLFIVQERLELYFESLWYSDAWLYEEITEDQILSLGVRPNLVPGRKGQPSLF